MTTLFPPDIEQKASDIVHAYAQAGLTLAMAESCTGGLIAACLTEVSGSSAVVERGFVTYSNEAKMQSIGVDSSLIAQYGAVSAEVARAMALGALLHSPADVAVSVTGIAGPTGGSKEKPVGLVYLSSASRGGEPDIRRCLFEGMGRRDVRLNAVRTALEMLELTIKLS